MPDEVILEPSVPYSREAEEAVLGSVLRNPDMLPVLRGFLREQDFYVHRHQHIWRAVCALADRSFAIDLATLSDELKKYSLLEEVGGPAFIIGLDNAAPMSFNAEDYGKIVQEHAIRRRLIRAAGSIAALAYDRTDPLEDVLARSIEILHAPAGELTSGRVHEAGKLSSDLYDRVEAAWKAGGVMPGIPSGFKKLDILLGGGFQPGQLTLVAGFPGVGKSAFLTSIILNVACAHPVALFTLEMGHEEVGLRMMAQLSGIDSQRLNSGKLTEDEWLPFTQATGDFGNLNLVIDDTSPLSMREMRAKCVQWRAQGRLDLIVVDYAGLLDAPGDTEYERFSRLSRELRLLAQETNCHILAAHQLNRKGREYEKPGIHHLRGSGTWEQDANNVILLSEPKEVKAGAEALPRLVDIAKQRSGPTGSLDYRLRRAAARWEEIV